MQLDARLARHCPQAHDRACSSKLHHDNIAYVIYTSGSTGSPKALRLSMEGFSVLFWAPEYLSDCDQLIRSAGLLFSFACDNRSEVWALSLLRRLVIFDMPYSTQLDSRDPNALGHVQHNVFNRRPAGSCLNR